VAALAHLRAHCEVTHVRAEVDTRNQASQRLLESLGFTSDMSAHPADPIGAAPPFDYGYARALP